MGRPCWSDSRNPVSGEPGTVHYALLYYTGLRIGEALHLEWDDILRAQNTILVRAKKNWQPKGRRPRSVPLHPDLIPYLDALPTVSGWMFAHADGRQRQYSGVKANFSRLLKRLDIGNASLKTWRHTFGTHLVRTTGDVKAAQEILGHQDIRHTMVYVHIAPGHLQRTVEKLAGPTALFMHNLSPNLSPRLSPGPRLVSTQRPKHSRTKEKKKSGRSRIRTFDFHRVRVVKYLRLNADVFLSNLVYTLNTIS